MDEGQELKKIGTSAIAVAIAQTIAICGLTSAALLFSERASAADVPQSFTLDGRLFSDSQGRTALADPSVVFKVQVLDEDKLCILYEETQTTSTLASLGYFSIQVGSSTGSLKRTITDSNLSMASVFSNTATVAGKAVADGSACSVIATAEKRRYVRIIIAPSTMGGTSRVLAPDLTIDSVPNAVIAESAESVQGLRKSSILQINTTGTSVLTQTNLENLFTSTARFGALNALVNGTSADYMRSNSVSGAQLPVMAGAPTGPAQGSIWFDTSDQKLKYQTSVGPSTLSTGGGTITGLTGDVTASGSGAVAATVALVGGSTAAAVNTATVAANAATSANTVSAIVRRDANGDFVARYVTITELKTSKITLNDSGTAYVSVVAPATVALSYTLTLPTAVGATGQVLGAIDNAGTLNWLTPAVSDANITYASKTANTFLAAPNGAAGVPTFRSIVLADLPSGVATTATGTAGRLAKYTSGSALANSLISDDGTKVTVASSVISTPVDYPTGATLDLRTSNTHVLSGVGGSVITLQNPSHGGLYNFVISDTTVRTYTFSGCTNSYFNPANAPTTASAQSVYGILMVQVGANWNCYINWSSGFQ